MIALPITPKQEVKHGAHRATGAEGQLRLEKATWIEPSAPYAAERASLDHSRTSLSVRSILVSTKFNSKFHTTSRESSVNMSTWDESRKTGSGLSRYTRLTGGVGMTMPASSSPTTGAPEEPGTVTTQYRPLSVADSMLHTGVHTGTNRTTRRWSGSTMATPMRRCASESSQCHPLPCANRGRPRDSH
ncbi:MAG: hypothetical protein ACHRHE_19200 [Tepidisphaerales bacterium]